MYSLGTFPPFIAFTNSRPVLPSSAGSIVNTIEVNNLINLCANNYLGLAENLHIKEAAKRGLDDWGYGMASVRFICGTQTLHKELENKL